MNPCAVKKLAKRVAFVLAVWCFLGADATESQIARFRVRSVTIRLAGSAWSSRTAQEGILLMIPWSQFTEQSFTRQNVEVRVEYWNGDNDTRVADDARVKRYDPKYGLSLLEKSLFLKRYGSLTVLYSDSRLANSVNWLAKHLESEGLRVADIIQDEKSSLEERVRDGEFRSRTFVWATEYR